jgi:hypothetical protein
MNLTQMKMIIKWYLLPTDNQSCGPTRKLEGDNVFKKSWFENKLRGPTQGGGKNDDASNDHQSM